MPHRLLASIAMACALAAVSPCRAQAAGDTAQLERRLEQSLKMIEALAARVEQLEKQLAAKPAAVAAAPAAAPASAPAARIEELERTVGQLTAASTRDLRDPGLPLHGFADVGWSQRRHAAPGERSGFAVGSLDFYLTPQFGTSIKTLIELNVGVEEDGETVIDLERAQIGYSFNDHLTLWGGRFHTPFGYWNMAFHHGAQIQPSILRPRMLDFEDDGGILPVHTTGLWGTGSWRIGADRLTYHLYVGNGTRIANGSLDPNPAGDDNANKVAGFALGWRFGGALDGLSVGVHGLRQAVAAYDAADALQSRTRLNMLGAHALYDSDGWELIAEAYRLRDRDLAGGASHGSHLGYLHVGHSLRDRWLPYARWEKASLDQADNYFAAQANGRSYTRRMLGMRYNLDPRAALKLEFNRTDDQGIGRAVDEWRLQYAVGF
ncbi:MAG TPA: hypothetical protein VF169_17575 [Albitalea sp.]